MKTQSSIKVIVQEELESFLLDFGVYLHKSLLVCVPISCNHIILTMNYIYYITVPHTIYVFPALYSWMFSITKEF